MAQHLAAARLACRWQEAAGDPARMAEALYEEIDDRRASGRGVSIANGARLVRRWREAAGDWARMAEALIDELDRSAARAIVPDRHRDRCAGGRAVITEIPSHGRC